MYFIKRGGNLEKKFVKKNLLVSIIYMLIAFVPSYRYIQEHGSVDVLFFACFITVSLVVFFSYFYFKSRQIKASIVYAIIYSVIISIVLTIIIPVVFPFIWQWGQVPKIKVK